MKITRLTNPLTEPISLKVAKQHLRVLHDFEDTLIESMYIPGARDTAEQYCERIFASAKFIAVDARFCSVFRLPKDTASIISVSYTDDDDAKQVIPDTDYVFDPDTQLLTPVDSWPSGSKPRITFWAGEDFDGSPAAIIDRSLLCAMLELLGDLYSNREAQVVGTIMTINPRTQAMLAPFRTNLGI